MMTKDAPMQKRRMGLVMMGLVMGVAACTTAQPAIQTQMTAGQRIYRAPGTADDPWGPYIQQAASQFSVPQAWIRAVMQQESGGKQYLDGQLTTSGAGAMGLMQLMPETYADMQAQYGLGGDPYDPHDNIMAGTAYIRQMYDRFGAPDFLAAYNAGPDRVEEWRRNGAPLPDETVQYVAAITPSLGIDASPLRAPTLLARADGVNPDAAYVPPVNASPVNASTDTASSTTSEPIRMAASLSRTADGCLRNADAAYDPAAPCLMDQDTPHDDGGNAPSMTAGAIAIADSAPLPGTQTSSAPSPILHAASYIPAPPGQWAVQIGAFSTDVEARQALDTTRQIIGTGRVPLATMVMPVPVAGGTLYRARFVGFAADDALRACQTLHAHAMACLTVPAHA